jgi:hypothetical protein
VTRAATRQPNFAKIVRPSNIMTSVTIPVADEKLPMKLEYELGSGKACLSLAFQETSTMEMHMPYEMTSVAKLRMYLLLNTNCTDSFMVIFGRFFLGNFFKPFISAFLATMLS